ncbi:hypothetical protein C0992_012569, partial [Termitomyces sp. T32_za158]
DERLAASISLRSQHNPSVEEVPDEDSPLLPDPLSPLGPVLEDLKGEGSAKDNTKTQHRAAPKTPPTPTPPLDAPAQAPTPLFLTDTTARFLSPFPQTSLGIGTRVGPARDPHPRTPIMRNLPRIALQEVPHK